jgi:hypothetical protein
MCLPPEFIGETPFRYLRMIKMLDRAVLEGDSDARVEGS